ncbi:chromate resistance protein ChrB domain-containing protein [Aeromonas sp. ASNIH5]|uniref:chromate resistance protein ChrB domain-containing protein n=1 Tax=Aeromonas sp. ASNIH5 TaxID=1758179 RepID=UPI000CD13DEE|nr:chromate resistance protein ChrB domain-containing protein [Aeromonas sp. ASNIH5]AUT42758.1 chromate resistance protein [Aeromonas sp. ASNIH5]
MQLIALILSLPTENATVRQRAWRALKAAGATVLRDGVYLMPHCQACHSTLAAVAAEVVSGGGSAYVLNAEAADDTDYARLFDRSQDYAALLPEITQRRSELDSANVQETLKQTRKLRKSFAALVAIDFFPDEPQRQVDCALRELELACARTLSPDEPQSAEGEIGRLRCEDYQGRIWATRQRPWVDRLASAWLIRRFIDRRAYFQWLASPGDCPSDAIGFDFDGAAFSHIGNRVTFEVLAESFGLDQPAIRRIGQLVHYLDVGGVQPPEAAGIESVLAGMRESLVQDDALLDAASTVFDGLMASFGNGTATT